MAADSAIYVRIDGETKRNAEAILHELGLTPSAVISMLYRQIILTNSLPFGVKLPVREPINAEHMSHEEIMQLVDEGLQDLKDGNVYTLEEAEKILKIGYGIDLSKDEK